MAHLDGPRVGPHRPGRPDALVLLLHGYGADGRDLADLGEEWGEALPGAAFVAPHAPEPCAETPVGRQWFPLTFRDPHELVRGTAAALPRLEAFAAEELAALGLPWSRLALVGFSQGAMMALELATRGRAAPAAVVSYSGLWVHAQDPEPAPEPGRGAGKGLRHRPPVLLSHGSVDELIPVEALFASAYGLAAAGMPAEWHLSHGLGHGIDPAGLAAGGAFLSRRLAAAAQRGLASQE